MSQSEQRKITTVVMPKPQIRVVDGSYRFTGKAIPVNVEGDVLDYLKAAGVYDSKADVGNQTARFYNECDATECLKKVDEVLPLIDRKRMEKDLEETGYAFLRATRGFGFFTFLDSKKESFICGMDRVTEGLVFQKISAESKLGYSVRHLTAQEAAELTASDADFKEMVTQRYINNSEIIQKIADEKVTAYRMKGEELAFEETDTEVLVPTETASVYFRMKYNWGFSAGSPLSFHNLFGISAVKKTASV